MLVPERLCLQAPTLPAAAVPEGYPRLPNLHGRTPTSSPNGAGEAPHGAEPGVFASGTRGPWKGGSAHADSGARRLRRPPGVVHVGAGLTRQRYTASAHGG